MKFMLTADHLKYFRAQPGMTERLRGYAYENQTISLSIIPILQPTVTKHIQTCMASLTSELNAKQCTLLRANRLYIKPRQLTLRGQFKWGKYINATANALKDAHSLSNHTSSETATSSSTHATTTTANLTPTNTTMYCLHFTCPAKHARVPMHPTFDPVRQQKQVWCPSCHKAWGTRKWTCPCGSPWLECALHINHPTLQPQATGTTRSKRPAPTPMTDHEADRQLAKLTTINQANSSHGQPTTISTNNRLSFALGPRLSAKFPKLAHQELPTPGCPTHPPHSIITNNSERGRDTAVATGHTVGVATLQREGVTQAEGTAAFEFNSDRIERAGESMPPIFSTTAQPQSGA